MNPRPEDGLLGKRRLWAEPQDAADNLLTERAMSDPFSSSVQEIKDTALEKRAMLGPHDPPWNGNVAVWFCAQLQNPLTLFVPHIGGVSSAIWLPLGPHAFNLALTGLYGCTSVIVVSRTGVWYVPCAP